jgi:16S rRNA (cytidine1402-2'-O)-methyltransferase
MPGKLYVVATPIGNLADMTFRAVETLKSVDLVACEDTRQTRKLMDHYGISVPLVSYHEHNETARCSELAAKIEAGASLAIVSDGGTPLVSDPGFRLVREVIARGLEVVPIPGACAAITALSASGLPTDAFLFCGFLPRKEGERGRLLASLASIQATLVFHEAPHRIVESLADVERELGDPPVVVARELTKMHEECLRGRASEVRAALAAREVVKGEITLLVGKSERSPQTEQIPIADAVRELEQQGVEHMQAIKQVARDRGLPKRDVYRVVEGIGKG